MNKFIGLSASLLGVVAFAGVASAQLPLTAPGTQGMRYDPNFGRGAATSPAPLTTPSTQGVRCAPSVRRVAYPTRRTVAAPAYRPVAHSAPAANAPVVGRWRVTSLRQFSGFALVIDRVDGSRIWYHTTMDSRPRLGNYFAATGFITFSHTDARYVTREFHGKIRKDSKGRWVLQGTYLGGDGVSASKIFFGDRLR